MQWNVKRDVQKRKKEIHECLGCGGSVVEKQS